MLNDIVTASEASRTIQVSRRHFERLVQSGRVLPFMQIGKGQMTYNRYLRSELLRFQDSVLCPAGDAKECDAPTGAAVVGSTPGDDPDWAISGGRRAG